MQLFHTGMRGILAVVAFFFATTNVPAQEVTEEDYRCAEQFLWSGESKQVYRAKVEPHLARQATGFLVPGRAKPLHHYEIGAEEHSGMTE